MKQLMWLILIMGVALGVSVAGAVNVSVLPEPMIGLESPEANVSFEKHGGVWTLTTQVRSAKAISSRKISETSEVVRADGVYNDARDWVKETLKNLRPVPGCKDIKVRIAGAVSTSSDLCSKVVAHRIFAAHLKDRILTVSR